MPPKLSPSQLGSVVAHKRRFRAQVSLNRTVQAGPLRARHADAVADLALVRSCQARVEIPTLLARLRTDAGRAPAKSSPRELGTVAPNKHRFRAEVKLQGKVAAGPSRPRAVDAKADLAMVRACPTRDAIPAVLTRLRAEAARTPGRLPPAKLGTVALHRNRFRAQVVLNGRIASGPLRTREADADADLALVRLCPARGDIPALLASLRADANVGAAPRDSSSRPSGAPSMRYSPHSPRDMESAFPALFARLRAECGGA